MIKRVGRISLRLRLDAATRDLLLFDRTRDIFLLCSKTRDIEAVLGPSVE